MRNSPPILRQKRSDTKMATIEKTYGKDFGVRSDMKLGSCFITLRYIIFLINLRLKWMKLFKNIRVVKCVE